MATLAELQNNMTKSKRKKHNLNYLIKNWDLYKLLLPGILLTLIFRYFPISGILIAFKDFQIFDGFFGSKWVGLANFNKIFSDDYFYTVFSNTLIISFLKLICVFPMPIILAVLINEVQKTVLKRTIQTVIYLPHFLSWSIVYGVFYALLSNEGPVNNIRSFIGLERIPYFISSSSFRSVIVGTDAWKSVGWGTIIYLAALTGIDKELYDASLIDGANKINQILHITLPGILSTVVVMFVMRLGALLNAGFEQIFIMYNPTVYNVADIIDTYVYRIGLGQQQFSYASAVGLFNSLVGFILIVSGNFVSRKFFGRSMW